MRIHQKLLANASTLPPEASAPLVQSRSIDDVPVMALTLWGKDYDDARLRQECVRREKAQPQAEKQSPTPAAEEPSEEAFITRSRPLHLRPT